MPQFTLSPPFIETLTDLPTGAFLRLRDWEKQYRDRCCDLLNAYHDAKKAAEQWERVASQWQQTHALTARMISDLHAENARLRAELDSGKRHLRVVS